VSLAGLMAAWSRAWAISRHVDPPASVAGNGWRIEVGKADQRRRFLFSDCDPAVLRPLAQTIGEPFVLLKVCTDAPTLRAVLPDDWGVAQLGYMMVDETPSRASALATGYRLSVECAPPFIMAKITTDQGALAASGQVILVDGLAVCDQIVTQEAHRRRGLGQAVMLALKAAASEAGARTGALSATLMGRDLYLSLGWRQVSDYTTGASPGTTPFP
jgi:GNAT superfamily N-acetyltransferase